MGSSPKAPDPYATAQAQSNANFTTAQQNAILGNVNEYSPYGSKTYSQIGWDPVYDSSGKLTYAPRYQSQVQLSPDQQKLLGQQTGVQYNLGNLGLSQSSRLQSLLGKEMNTEGLQGWQAAAAPGEVRQDQTPTDRAAIERAMMSRYDTDAQQQNAAQEAQAAARGLTVGGAGYGRMKALQDRARGEALTNAYLGSGEESRAAQQAYNAAGQQRYTMGADYASQLNNLRQGQMQERIALRNQPINEIMALLGGSGVTTPQFQPFSGPNMQPVDLAGMINQNYASRANASAAQNQGMFGLGGAAISALPLLMMMSDRRLKEDVKAIGRTLAGVPLYFFRFSNSHALPIGLRGKPHIGVMADEVIDRHPDAVIRLADGYLRVDYGLLMKRSEY